MNLKDLLDKNILGTTENYIKSLNKAGILTIGDFINLFPRDYDDRNDVLDSFAYLNLQEKNTIVVNLISAETSKTNSGKILTKAVVSDKNESFAEAVWFNNKFLGQKLEKLTGKKIILNGKVKYNFGKISFSAPDLESDLSKLSGEIVPIYSDINYIPGNWIGKKMGLLRKYFSLLEENLPENILKKYEFIPKSIATEIVHFPKNFLELENAKRRLAYEELYEINFVSISRKHENFKLSEGKALSLKMNSELIKEIIGKLPFPLTDAQKIALFQILKDMENSHSMQRMLQGDVGTGKTIVMIIAGIHAILESEKYLNQDRYSNVHRPVDITEQKNSGGQDCENLQINFGEDSLNIVKIKNFSSLENVGNDSNRSLLEQNSSFLLSGIMEYGKKNRIQVAIMAPTEILATQHFLGNKDFLESFGISSILLVGSTKAKEKKSIKEALESGEIDLIFGTHALIEEDVIFKNLGFVTIDEQHRFGVKQRGNLENSEKNISKNSPHILNMTATPIPRSLALTLYGDQDLSVIAEYPKGRKEIFTKVIKNETEEEQMNLFIRNELEKGRQVFWISPLVSESEKIDLANAEATYESLVEIFSPFKVGLLHGKMKAKEKSEIMAEFEKGEIKVLSSTSVVEVGVNIPNATVMVIEGAERFGLSQLHQFRGRVGRGQFQSYCYLKPTNGQKTDRLRAMEKTNNGFELSEIDLELRGPGEVYGFRQSGVPDLKIADLRDLELISQIREDIEEGFKSNL